MGGTGSGMDYAASAEGSVDAAPFGSSSRPVALYGQLLVADAWAGRHSGGLAAVFLARGAPGPVSGVNPAQAVVFGAEFEELVEQAKQRSPLNRQASCLFSRCPHRTGHGTIFRQATIGMRSLVGRGNRAEPVSVGLGRIAWGMAVTIAGLSW